MDALRPVFDVIGIVAYVAVVVAMAVLALDAWSRCEPKRLALTWLLLGVIALLQLVGLVAIQNGTPDLRLWFLNRLFWFALSVVALSMAYRAFRGWLVRVFEMHVERWFLKS